jgi:two-component system, OmpR family, phosphate regulon sensor histidine kinase PhoR
VFHSIRWRITLPFLLLSLVSLLSLGLVLSTVFRQTYLDNLEAKLASQARLAADVVVPLLQGGSSRTDLDAVARHWAGILEARVTFVALDGTVLGESHDASVDMENHRSRPEIAAALANGQGSSTRFSQTVGYEMMYTAVIILQDGQPLGVVRMAVPLQEVAASVARVQRILAAATLIVIALTILLAGLISYRTTRPVRQLTQAVRQLTDSPWTGTPLHTYLPTARDEVGQLAQAFNVMSPN